MKIAAIVDEAALLTRECEDHATNLERAIALGHVERMRARHPALRAVARAVKSLAAWRDKLPAEFIAEVEREP